MAFLSFLHFYYAITFTRQLIFLSWKVADFYLSSFLWELKIIIRSFKKGHQNFFNYSIRGSLNSSTKFKRNYSATIKSNFTVVIDQQMTTEICSLHSLTIENNNNQVTSAFPQVYIFHLNKNSSWNSQIQIYKITFIRIWPRKEKSFFLCVFIKWHFRTINSCFECVYVFFAHEKNSYVSWTQ